MYQTRNVCNLQLLFDTRNNTVILSCRAAIYLSKVFWRYMMNIGGNDCLHTKKHKVFKEYYQGEPIEIDGGCFFCEYVSSRSGSRADCYPNCPLVSQYKMTCRQLGFSEFSSDIPKSLYDAIQNLNVRKGSKR